MHGAGDGQELAFQIKVELFPFVLITMPILFCAAIWPALNKGSSSGFL